MSQRYKAPWNWRGIAVVIAGLAIVAAVVALFAWVAQL